MKNIIIEKLEKEVEFLIDELDKLTPDADEYNDMLTKLGNLTKILNAERDTVINELKVDNETKKLSIEKSLKEEAMEIDRVKTDNEYNIKSKQLELDQVTSEEQRLIDKERLDIDSSIKNDQLNLDKVGSILKVGVEVASIVAPLVFYGVWMNKGFKFEEEGTITSSTFKGLIGKFRPTK